MLNNGKIFFPMYSILSCLYYVLRPKRPHMSVTSGFLADPRQAQSSPYGWQNLVQFFSNAMFIPARRIHWLTKWSCTKLILTMPTYVTQIVERQLFCVNTLRQSLNQCFLKFKYSQKDKAPKQKTLHLRTKQRSFPPHYRQGIPKKYQQ